MTKAVAEKLTANTRHTTTGEYAEQPNDGQQMANVQPSRPVLITNVHEPLVVPDDTPPPSPQTPIISDDDDIPSHLAKDDHHVDVSPTMTCPKQFTQANLS
jgi:hypothetical protein